MSLAAVYEKLYGAKEAAEKKAEGEDAAQAAAETNQAAAETQETQLTDAQIDEALSQMSDEELAALAKDMADNIKEKEAAAQAEAEKQAEELFAAGRIFGQGFIAEVSGKNGETKTSSKSPTAIEKFSAMLEKELQNQKK
jgi:hypothetical protein